MTSINLNSIIKLSGLIMIIIGCSFLLCVPVALLYSESISPFVFSALAACLPGLLLFKFTPGSVRDKISTKEGYLNVAISWVLLALIGTLPYLFSESVSGFINAFFESMSGFTTTGATVIGNIEILPRSILFWRSLTHWIGGVGVILLVIVILPNMKSGGYHLFTLESSMKQKILPKTRSIASTILIIYLSMTILEVGLLCLGDMNLFDSICHTFATVATAGFSTRNTSISEYSPYIQYVIAIFMFLGGISYIVYYLLVKREFRKIATFEEVWFYFFFVTAAVAVVTLILYTGTERNLALSFRHGFFQVISQMTGTGFATTDYMLWPQAGWFLMILLMPAGGCTGSTTGGMKMARHLIALRNLKVVFRRFQHHHAVIPIKLNDRIIPDNLNITILSFILLYLAIAFIGMLAIHFTGVPLIEAVGASASAISNVGPGLGASGNFGHYNAFTGSAKMIMAALMVTGRLEIFTILALFTRSFWKN
ncbi:MAG TPA: TrkH family potassium uptake protein [Bacteroidales bacterium]|jgi:trk system potassium uptake protein TrkH|nr:TrkH family potassium uptake protein [Bacteroidales bacterium]NLD62687.1 TrkH family potassium uptake protein [Bacteroidales bacterium]HOO66709.1 TrkH family potassium uptake protein [Bacteroidales bacterium]HPE22981.1 TrkH family potassium uptake protein [Bacteroidales bacterium]HPQ64102.1 TrkH family potassium uptake protein [Bacteroidales bacterium]